MIVDIAAVLVTISILILARWGGSYFAAWRHRHHISQSLWIIAVLSFLGLLITTVYLIRHVY
ncbi:MAG: hypothetical protein C7B46_00400 [Sulfobacillus benefaciens]|uniref:Uncharacterized protein n=1 Tax=Sulfobacillus benefaciens TaxID=453960 RepID=A0A2T2XLW5_9FIRM|nr:MAG: hypothetical protein C7B46_00400 [Sulfobacillus benefaciens]